MALRRTCKERRAEGQPCRMAPLLDSDYCWVHDPANAEAAAEARRAGGMQRRREGTFQVVYDFVGVETVPDIQWLVTLTIVETLALPNGVARNRTLLAGAQVATKLLETGVLEDRIKVLEQAVLRQRPDQASPFDHEPPTPFVGDEEATG
jgi:hypothetical protein